MNQNQRENDGIEIDLKDVLMELWSKLPILILAAIIGGLLMFLYSSIIEKPVYQSTTKMYVISRITNGDDDTLTQSDLSAGTQLTKDYEQVIKSRNVLESAIARLQLYDGDKLMNYSKLSGKVSVSSPDSTRFVFITVKDSDPYRACDIADAVRQAATETIQQVMDKTIRVVDQANIPTSQSSPDVKRNMLIGAIIGFIIAAVISIIIHLSNDSIKTSEDIEKYLGLYTLGVIPLAQGEKKSKKVKKSKIKASSVSRGGSGK